NRGPLSHERVVELVCQVLDAMEYAHNAGVLHRDLKPKNLLLHPSGRVQVTDFGVAGLIGIDETQMGSMLGTAPYMAPELYTGTGRVDRRTDIYALGMTLYKLLVGRLPFSRDMNPYMVLRAKEEGRVPLPAELGVDVPAPLVEVLFRALRPNPNDRFPSCAAFRDTLREGQRFQSSVPARTAPIRLEPVERAPEPQSRLTSGQLAMLLLVCGLLAAVIALALDSGELEAFLGGDQTQYESSAHQDPPVLAAVSESPPPGLPPDAELRSPASPELEAPPQEALMPESSGTGGSQPLTLSSRGTRDERAAERRREARRKRRARARARQEQAEARRLERTADPGSSSSEPEQPPRAAQPLDADSAEVEAAEATRSEEPRSEVEAVTPTEPEGPAVGVLHLSANPACEVSIDGRSYGTTDKTRRGLVLAEGIYKVRFVCANEAVCGEFNRRAGVKTLQVYAGETSRYQVDFYALNQKSPAP
ncbi:MAG: serine/threonine-protein kinase, partial [Myxococcota bacterium]|nr:serine/threonine-protein kinase [Myxococcota bacterium]